MIARFLYLHITIYKNKYILKLHKIFHRIRPSPGIQYLYFYICVLRYIKLVILKTNISIITKSQTATAIYTINYKISLLIIIIIISYLTINISITLVIHGLNLVVIRFGLPGICGSRIVIFL